MNEILPLVEISFSTANVAPGAVTSATPVGVLVAFTLGSVGGGLSAATFALGDTLRVIPPAGAALNGLYVSASPTATPGTAQLIFSNFTGGSITPVGGIYKMISERPAANIVV